MTTRVLSPDEWPLVNHTELADVWPHLDPQKAQILVVESPEGHIVACWAAMRVTHLEGIWIDPAYRKSLSVGRRLLEAMRALLTGERTVFTSALTDSVSHLIEDYGGQELPGRHFVMRMS